MPETSTNAALLAVHVERGSGVPLHRQLEIALRDALLAAIETHLPMMTTAGISAGLHLVAWLPDDLDETVVVEAARRAGVSVDAIGPYRIESTGPGGLIFGFAACAEHLIAEGVALIARAIKTL